MQSAGSGMLQILEIQHAFIPSLYLSLSIVFLLLSSPFNVAALYQPPPPSNFTPPPQATDYYACPLNQLCSWTSLSRQLEQGNLKMEHLTGQTRVSVHGGCGRYAVLELENVNKRSAKERSFVKFVHTSLIYFLIHVHGNANC
jgi:hypothetical protein